MVFLPPIGRWVGTINLHELRCGSQPLPSVSRPSRGLLTCHCPSQGWPAWDTGPAPHSRTVAKWAVRARDTLPPGDAALLGSVAACCLACSKGPVEARGLPAFLPGPPALALCGFQPGPLPLSPCGEQGRSLGAALLEALGSGDWIAELTSTLDLKMWNVEGTFPAPKAWPGLFPGEGIGVCVRQGLKACILRERGGGHVPPKPRGPHSSSGPRNRLCDRSSLKSSTCDTPTCAIK